MGAALGTAAVGSLVGVAGGYSKWREGRKTQKEAQRNIDSFEWDTLNNAFDNTKVSTLGADMQREESARMAATALAAVQSAGTRGLGVGLGRISQTNNNVNRQIAADLDQQQKTIDFAKAQDDIALRGMQERRQAEELQGYGQMLTVGQQMKYQGVSDISNGLQGTAMLGMSAGSGAYGGMGGVMGSNPPSTQATTPVNGSPYNNMYTHAQGYGGMYG